MSLKVGEYGKTIRVDSDFDLTANTELTLVFTKPDGTILTKVKADGVSAPGVDVTSPDGELFAANEYFEYDFASGDLDQAGRWFVRGEYDDATPKNFIGDTVEFTVMSV